MHKIQQFNKIQYYIYYHHKCINHNTVIAKNQQIHRLCTRIWNIRILNIRGLINIRILVIRNIMINLFIMRRKGLRVWKKVGVKDLGILLEWKNWRICLVSIKENKGKGVTTQHNIVHHRPHLNTITITMII